MNNTSVPQSLNIRVQYFFMPMDANEFGFFDELEPRVVERVRSSGYGYA